MQQQIRSSQQNETLQKHTEKRLTVKTRTTIWIATFSVILTLGLMRNFPISCSNNETKIKTPNLAEITLQLQPQVTNLRDEKTNYKTTNLFLQMKNQLSKTNKLTTQNQIESLKNKIAINATQIEKRNNQITDLLVLQQTISLGTLDIYFSVSVDQNFAYNGNALSGWNILREYG
jgi:hypothetical protein